MSAGNGPTVNERLLKYTTTFSQILELSTHIRRIEFKGAPWIFEKIKAFYSAQNMVSTVRQSDPAPDADIRLSSSKHCHWVLE